MELTDRENKQPVKPNLALLMVEVTRRRETVYASSTVPSEKLLMGEARIGRRKGERKVSSRERKGEWEEKSIEDGTDGRRGR